MLFLCFIESYVACLYRRFHFRKKLKIFRFVWREILFEAVTRLQLLQTHRLCAQVAVTPLSALNAHILS
jgi:hypothetical protein